MKKIPRWISTVSTEIHLFNPSLISIYAAASTLFIIISFFPFMIVLLSCVRLIPATHQYLMTLQLDFVPEPIRELVAFTLDEVVGNTSGVVLPIAVIMTLGSASSGVMALMKGLNIVYNKQETRPNLLVRVVCAGYTISFVLLILAVLVVLVFGTQLLRWIQQSIPTLSEIWQRIPYISRISTIVFLLFFFTLLYRYVPNRKTNIISELPGACFSAIGWLIFSWAYSLYISTISNYSSVYGSLTAVVLMIIWLYCCIYILFIGAQINKRWEQHRYFKNKNRRLPHDKRRNFEDS